MKIWMKRGRETSTGPKMQFFPSDEASRAPFWSARRDLQFGMGFVLPVYFFTSYLQLKGRRARAAHGAVWGGESPPGQISVYDFTIDGENYVRRNLLWGVRGKSFISNPTAIIISTASFRNSRKRPANSRARARTNVVSIRSRGWVLMLVLHPHAITTWPNETEN